MAFLPITQNASPIPNPSPLSFSSSKWLPSLFLLLPLIVLLSACSTPRPLPKYQPPIARTQFQSVRTTAYTHTESDHTAYSNHNALGGTLLSGPIHSAAADWSRWPAGTVFRIVETGEVFQVDDYGWALAGTNTIDLYRPTKDAMNAWGVRRVTIENLHWGDPSRSLCILHPRAKYRHIRRMVDQLNSRIPRWNHAVETASPTAISVTNPSPIPQKNPPPNAFNPNPFLKTIPTS